MSLQEVVLIYVSMCQSIGSNIPLSVHEHVCMCVIPNQSSSTTHVMCEAFSGRDIKCINRNTQQGTSCTKF